MYLRASFVRVVAKAAPTKKSPSIMYCLMGGLQWLTMINLNIGVQSTCTSYTQPQSKLGLISWLNTRKNFAFKSSFFKLQRRYLIHVLWFYFSKFWDFKKQQFFFSISLIIGIYQTVQPWNIRKLMLNKSYWIKPNKKSYLSSFFAEDGAELNALCVA